MEPAVPHRNQVKLSHGCLRSYLCSIQPSISSSYRRSWLEPEIINVASFGNNAAILQALDLGADFIAITGTPPATIADEIAIAQERGVGMYMCFDNSHFQIRQTTTSIQTAGEANVYAAAKPTRSLLNQAVTQTFKENIPDFGTVSEREGAKAAYAENCPNCSFQELAVTLDQLLTGGVPEPSFQLSKLTTASTGYTSLMVWHTASSTH